MAKTAESKPPRTPIVKSKTMGKPRRAFAVTVPADTGAVVLDRLWSVVMNRRTPTGRDGAARVKGVSTPRRPVRSGTGLGGAART